MLELRNIIKDYQAGDTAVHALKGINIEFRKSEFVSILGPSGCGKTTLLNIVGGLDRYTSGDLIINGKSTKEFGDSDWDSYRNHSIGFVFQNYNLIPHQTVLSNVELALTLTGVSKAERRKRAKEALEKVGLGDQLNKKPNQMSGGQMQRVAIARALVNNPEILLADEPTGALDSETSVQIMEILKEVASERLVIMVTHNPELAKEYSTRIINLLDGEVQSDSMPYTSEKTDAPKQEKKSGRRTPKVGMSFFTALSLSINNLMTKKARTILTAFAGSIGIIGIALILSVSNGVQNFINDVQRDTLSSYPITIQAETLDLSQIMASFMGVKSENEDPDETPIERDEDKVYLNSVMYDMMNSFMNTETQKNNLTAFRKYIENSEEFKKYTTSIQYAYNYDMNVFTKDIEGKIIKSDAMTLIDSLYSSAGMSTSYLSGMSSSLKIWEEMLPGEDGELVNPLLKEQYNLVAGEWPDAYDEVVLIVNRKNELSDMVLYTLGLITKDQIMGIYKAMTNKEPIETEFGPWDFDEIIWQEGEEASFKLILSSELFVKQLDNTYSDMTKTDAGLAMLYGKDEVGIQLKISGIIKANEEASSAMLSGYIAYTSALTDKVIDLTSTNELLLAQMADKETDVITGLPFKPVDYDESSITDAEKKEKITEYFSQLSAEERTKIYKEILMVPKASYIEEETAKLFAMFTEEQLKEMTIQAILSQYPTLTEEQLLANYDTMDDQYKAQIAMAVLSAQVTMQYSAKMGAVLQMADADSVETMFTKAEYDEKDFAGFYDSYMPREFSESTYDDNLDILGYISKDAPSSISIYCDTFENKDKVSELIKAYNASVEDEDDEIEYTDYVALLMSSITTIINAISYVLIAFVAISLVVSSIMIGIITYISVLERTKEIGILRSIGASKRDVSRVFNAETLIVGFVAGIIGIGVTLILILPINALLLFLTDLTNLRAALPVSGAVTLILISMVLTLIAGIIPSRLAAKKDPVVALRTE